MIKYTIVLPEYLQLQHGRLQYMSRLYLGLYQQFLVWGVVENAVPGSLLTAEQELTHLYCNDTKMKL